MITRSFNQAQADANNTYNVVLADCLSRGLSDEDANVMASRAYTDAMTTWEDNTPYPDQSAVFAARADDAKSSTPIYVDWIALNKMSRQEWEAATLELEAKHNAREDWRHCRTAE